MIGGACGDALGVPYELGGEFQVLEDSVDADGVRHVVVKEIR